MPSCVEPELLNIENRAFSVVRIREDFNREVLLDAIVEIQKTQDERDGFLLDLRQAWNALDTSVAYRFAYEKLAELDFPRAMRGAILTPTDNTAHEFLCVVARNASYNWRSFNDEAEALAWLNS